MDANRMCLSHSLNIPFPSIWDNRGVVAGPEDWQQEMSQIFLPSGLLSPLVMEHRHLYPQISTY